MILFVYRVLWGNILMNKLILSAFFFVFMQNALGADNSYMALRGCPDLGRLDMFDGRGCKKFPDFCDRMPVVTQKESESDSATPTTVTGFFSEEKSDDVFEEIIGEMAADNSELVVPVVSAAPIRKLCGKDKEYIFMNPDGSTWVVRQDYEDYEVPVLKGMILEVPVNEGTTYSDSTTSSESVEYLAKRIDVHNAAKITDSELVESWFA